MTDRATQAFLKAAFRASVRAVRPEALVRERFVRRDGVPALLSNGRSMRRFDRGELFLVVAGKAASGMARAILPVLGDRLAAGVVVGPGRAPGFAKPVLSFAGGHPTPNGGSIAAGRAVWKMLAEARTEDTVLVLLSGGASSLLALPAPGISLDDKIATTGLLLRAGAGIAELNAVRKHLSRLKGGGLARRAAPARVVCAFLSDVVGSSPAVVGSGPAATDPTTFADAWRVLERYDLVSRVPGPVRRRLDSGRRGRLPETRKPGEGRVLHVRLADVRKALEAAAGWIRSRGIETRIVSASLRGDTRRAAERLAREAIGIAGRSRRRSCLLAGGETTVRVRGTGRGGRNQEFALAFARAIAGSTGISCLSAGTDGIDGPTDAAGAVVDSSTISRARRRGLDPDHFLDDNDSYRFFAALGGLFRPGPTGTNVMDLKIVRIDPRGRR